MMVKKDPKSTLENMERFTAEYIAVDDARVENLVKVYLGLIQEDSCDDSSEFYIFGNGRSITESYFEKGE